MKVQSNSVITLTASVIIATLLLIGTTSTVMADTTANQETNTSTHSRVTCTTGSYGQNLNCVAESDATASAKQQVIVRGDTRIVPHTPVAASLDFRTIALAATTALTGTAGIIIKYVTKI